MDSRWRIELLGGLCARQGDRVLTRFDTRKTAALLACLALDLGRAHSREELAEQLWPGEDPEATRSRLRQALAVLRRALEPPGTAAESVLLATRRSDVQLDPSGVTTDVAEFQETLRSAASATDPVARIAMLVRAMELYRGELLPGYHEEWIVAARGQLAEAYFGASHALVEELERAGEHPKALEYARRAVAGDPLREEAQRDLIRLLARTGQTSDALRQYREFERLLKQELDAVPSAASRALAEQLAAGTVVPAAERKAQEATAVRAPVPEHAGAQAAMPTGTATFLLTDIEGSTRLWEQHREAMGNAVARHDDLAASVVARFHGMLLKRRGEGDSLFAVFSRARDAVAAACALQQALQSEPWPAGIPIRVRMAVHTGEAEVRDGDYYGPDVNRCARLRATATGGQILLSQATRDLTGDVLPAGASLRDLGERPLRDLERPERVYQLNHPDFAGDFTPGQDRRDRRIARHAPRGYPARHVVAPPPRRLIALVGCFLLLLLLGLVMRPKLEARWLYWKGRDAWNERTERGFERARRYFEEATARDPAYAPAYTGLADTYILLGYYSYLPPKEAALGASQATRKAMDRDKASAGAYTARAMAAMIFDWDWEAARTNFARAIERDPGYATARQWHSLFLIVQGPREESLEEIGRAGGLDISSRVISKSAGGRYYYLGQYDRAIQRCNETIKLDPNYSLAHYWLGLALTQKRDYKTAEKAIKDGYWLSSDAGNFEEAYKGFRGSATMLASLAHLHAVRGRKADAREILARLQAERGRGTRYVSPVGIATVYAGLGEQGQAIRWLDTGLQERACEMIFLHVDPVFAPLDGNPRFIQILGEIGLPQVPRRKSG